MRLLDLPPARNAFSHRHFRQKQNQTTKYMSSFIPDKYQPYRFSLPNREWPDREITRAPTWCSVDLRDGNQSIPIPMNVEQKLEYFDMLVRIGFKEIEVGFPAASDADYDFVRRLIDEKRIPEDVTIQILCQCRDELIDQSLASLQGARKVIFHLYNSTSPAQRRVVFGKNKQEIMGIATHAVGYLKEHMGPMVNAGTSIKLQYSPESFSATEIEFAKEVCEAVMEVWQPTPQNRIILNLPATVECSRPGVYADQIEWMCRNIKNREHAVISLHTHNDRGTCTAATELGMQAGADRVEGTLFGNGERTGNLDLVTVALNMHVQNVDSGLDFSNLPKIVEVYERLTGMKVPPRQPYAGELVFTAFSGSHQDAIKKGLAERQQSTGDSAHPWDVPYIHIDPQDLGREYTSIIRVNSQSGKGGVAAVLEQHYGLHIPREMQPEVGRIVGAQTEVGGKQAELPPEQIYRIFSQEYLRHPQALVSCEVSGGKKGGSKCNGNLRINGRNISISGEGVGAVAAFCNAMQEAGVPAFEIAKIEEHSINVRAVHKNPTDAKAACYTKINTGLGKSSWGAAISTDTQRAYFMAILSALHRAGALANIGRG